MWIQMKSKYKAKCRRCYTRIKKGQMIEWHPEKKTVRHLECEENHKIKATSNRRPARGRVRHVA